ncbi:uncharacterized protein [Lolium perenne]|uniref:uncharacterized protein n=1 Tax=Lolium perenne TaxID=4522 RepID=UPI0021F58653|nr:uncharacterized protein LOC127326727 [Lolium perenne]
MDGDDELTVNAPPLFRLTTADQQDSLMEEGQGFELLGQDFSAMAATPNNQGGDKVSFFDRGSSSARVQQMNLDPRFVCLSASTNAFGAEQYGSYADIFQAVQNAVGRSSPSSGAAGQAGNSELPTARQTTSQVSRND